jgi:hypothetical protein
MKNIAKSLPKSPLSVASRNEQAKVLPLLNPKREALNPAILKSFSGYQHLTDTEAEEKCASIRTFARLLLEYFASVENTISIDNQQIVSLEGNQDSKVVPINQVNKKRKAA